MKKNCVHFFTPSVNANPLLDAKIYSAILRGAGLSVIASHRTLSREAKMSENNKMPESDSKTEIFSKIWDSLSTRGKLVFILFLAAVLGSGFWSGYWFGNLIGENKTEATEAKYEREITELKRQLADKSKQTSDNVKPQDYQLGIEVIHNDLEFEKIVPISEDVSQKVAKDGTLISKKEIASFRFIVRNLSTKVITISTADLLVDAVEHKSYDRAVPSPLGDINHLRDVEAIVNDKAIVNEQSTVGDYIPIPFNVTIEPNAKRQFSVWFVSPTAFKRHVVLYIKGVLRLHYDNKVCYSDIIEMEIHSDELPL